MLESKFSQQEDFFVLCGHSISHGERLQDDHGPSFEGFLRRFLARVDAPINRLVLTGSGATYPLFLSSPLPVFWSHGDLDEQNYLRDVQSYTFTSARQGAS
jgi:hypothetical protein